MPLSQRVLWEVDTQVDFLLPSGKLYVPGAEKLLPNIHALVDSARQGRAFLVSHGCFHAENDPEFSQYPPHCVRGTPGAEFVPEALAHDVLRVPNDPKFTVADWTAYQQILMEKQTLDIFETCHADTVVDRFGKSVEFAVFGVVTEICVIRAVRGLLQRGRKVAIISDAVAALQPHDGHAAMAEMEHQGARIITTKAALDLR
jgi:nicotinamidase/pyrazinamidase